VIRPALNRAELPAMLQKALDLAIDAKAVGPVVLQLTEVAGYTDYALIVSGRSDRHVGGISEAIMAGLKAQLGVSPIGSDGLDEHLWDLLDYDDFLVHVFYHPVRKHYDLESMWNDAPTVELNLPADVMDTAGLEDLAPPNPMPAFRGGSFGAFEGELDDEDEAATGELDPALAAEIAAQEAADADDGDYVEDEDAADDDDDGYSDDYDNDDLTEGAVPGDAVQTDAAQTDAAQPDPAQPVPPVPPRRGK
jgi:ribosome silencing factor RsfS/YbeB/iojap